MYNDLKLEKVELVSIYCTYHPNRIAIAKCSKCNRFICDEDRKTLNSGIYNFSHYHDYCPTCFAIKFRKQTFFSNKYSILASGFILFILAIIFYESFTSPNFFSASLIIIILFLTFIPLGIISLQKIAFKSKKSEKKFFQRNFSYSNFIGSLPSIIEHDNGEEPSFEDANIDDKAKPWINCIECGERILINDNFCPKCGKDTSKSIEYFFSR